MKHPFQESALSSVLCDLFFLFCGVGGGGVGVVVAEAVVSGLSMDWVIIQS